MLARLCFAASVCVVFVLGSSTSANAQNLPVPSSVTTLSGRWTGVFDTVRPDGSIAPDTAFFNLQEQGNNLSGGAGNNDKKLSPVTSGHRQGQYIDFDVPANASMTVHFHLHSEGDHLVGEATGMPADAGTKFVVDVVRWPYGTPSPIVQHTPDSLFRTVAALDTKLFDAYNHCDLATLGDLVSNDLEFYHDKTGLTVGKKPFVDAIQQNICGKVERTLVAGSLEVYPLAHYGAVEIGIHRFTHPGHPEEGVGEAKFVMLWQNKEGKWFITRAISFDHAPAQK
jgi:hypothetical protein